MSGTGGMPPSYTGPVPEKETTAYKAAKAAVIVLSALILLALVALVVGGIAKLSGKSAPARTGGGTSYQLPPGARIVSMDSQPGRLILRVRTGAREEIDIFDIQSGQLVGQVKTGPTQSDKP
jgi:hypothetical protein